ncbi:hypothetical protein TNCV_3126451 [Trichonephila clavipes]|nr:hypothetical protein TNCV_3126451 [Trichonephila clavipes]
MSLEKWSSQCHIHHIWHYRVRLRESGQPIGRLRKTCKNAFPGTIPVSFSRLDTPIATESSLNKYGKFTEDCIPDGVFPIGDDVFVFAGTYYDSVSVHIRRFKKYGKTYYPTPEGITLDPRWIEYIMRKKKMPESLEELPSRLFPPERHIQITSENFIDFTFKRIKYAVRIKSPLLKK